MVALPESTTHRSVLGLGSERRVSLDTQKMPSAVQAPVTPAGTYPCSFQTLCVLLCSLLVSCCTAEASSLLSFHSAPSLPFHLTFVSSPHILPFSKRSTKNTTQHFSSITSTLVYHHNPLSLQSSFLHHPHSSRPTRLSSIVLSGNTEQPYSPFHPFRRGSQTIKTVCTGQVCHA